jgi:protein phosphatase
MLVIGGCRTDIGTTRKNNQDAVLFRKHENGGSFFVMGVVCDGIGGLEHGEIASYEVIKAANMWFDNVSEWIEVNSVDREIIFAHFKDAAEEWNGIVRKYIVEQNISTGTTMSAIIILQEYYYVIHVGDSRVYRYNGVLEQVTNDESIARMTKNQMRLYLDNYIGKRDELEFKTYQGRINNGDMFIYCSDGFYHTLKLNDVKYVYEHIKSEEIQELCKRVIEKRIKCGETDNLSVGFIYCE